MEQMKTDLASLPAVLDMAKRISEKFWEVSSDKPAAVLDDFNLDHHLLPETGGGAAEAMDLFQKDIMPYLSRSIGPRYFGFVTGGVTPAALAGDWLTSAIDQNPASPGDSIASTFIHRTIQLLLELFELPTDEFDGAFTSGATAANLLAMVTAREWCAANTGVDVTNEGIAALGPVEVFSACPHASLVKVLGTIGLGRKAVVPVGSVGSSEEMDVEALDRAMAASDNPNKIVVASAATVTANDFDDLIAVAEICRKHKAWMHVDAAFGIFARSLTEKKGLVRGLELADSITADGHKWLNVPYDSGLFFTRHIDLLEKAQGIVAPYLKTKASAPTYMNRSVENSQRFRALPAWMTLQAYGKAGIVDIVRRNCQFAEALGEWIDQSPDYELLCPVKLNVVTFRGKFSEDKSSQENERLLRALNLDGRIFCTPGAMNGKDGIRAAISNWRTEDQDLDITIAALSEVYAAVTEGAGNGT